MWARERELKLANMRRLQAKTSKKPLYSWLVKDRKITAIRNSAQMLLLQQIFWFYIVNISYIYINIYINTHTHIYIYKYTYTYTIMNELWE